MSTEPIVIDATLALSWCFADEATTYSQGVLAALRQRHAVVPSTWFFDVISMLVNAQRHQRIHAAGVEAFLQHLRRLPIRIDYSPRKQDLAAHFSAAQRLVLTPYNLAYLDLARSHGLSLATLDDGLRAAARVTSVKLLEVALG